MNLNLGDMIQKFQKLKYVAASLMAIVLFVTGGVVGRATAPVHVEERVQVKVVEVEKVRVEWKDKTVVRKVYVQNTRKNVIREEREVIRPDGTVEREKVEKLASETSSSATASATAEKVGAKIEERVFQRTVDTEKKVTPAREWSLALMVGVAPRASFMPPTPPSPLVLGVHVQKKIVGPVTLGGWVLTSPGAGVSLGLEF